MTFRFSNKDTQIFPTRIFRLDSKFYEINILGTRISITSALGISKGKIPESPTRVSKALRTQWSSAVNLGYTDVALAQLQWKNSTRMLQCVCARSLLVRTLARSFQKKSELANASGCCEFSKILSRNYSLANAMCFLRSQCARAQLFPWLADMIGLHFSA